MKTETLLWKMFHTGDEYIKSIVIELAKELGLESLSIQMHKKLTIPNE